ncbi:winged helix-turn-helix transcriptional regulator [Bacillaceae bacterium Marseille-Q3522]|nr:winged helix-turn-helix transcriptional regulator [Bacillaceae bacterium Marseille-Q3522]
MNEKERLILQFITDNPFITQNELAVKTNLSRSAVAGYISSLTKQGKLLGRAYVLPDRKDIICIGAANIDRKIQVEEQIECGTSNPAKTSQSCGGVARNIAENLGKLGCDTALLTVLGNDQEGKWICKHTKENVDMRPSSTCENIKTGTYTAILQPGGEMSVAFADMAIYDEVTVDIIEKRWGHISSANIVVLDTNFPKKVISAIIERCRSENIPICITTVSAPKIKKLPQDLSGVKWLVANQSEAETLTKMKFANEGDFFLAGQKIMKMGVEKVVITRAEQGVIYMTAEGDYGAVHAPTIHVEDATGAGDSLVAGIMYAYLKGANTEIALKFGISCSILTLQSPYTVNPDLNNKQLQKTFQRYFR